MSYRFIRQLAGGGFSDIFEIEDPESALPERLILKRLNGEMSARPAVRAAFAEEAKILRELKHLNIVTFRRCYFDERQRVCLLMEKVAGEPLDSWARRHASTPDVVLTLFERVLAAVDYLHHRGSPFLHLDLKPDNVLVTSTREGPEPVLIDFGIARRSGGAGLKAYTPPYGAPEQEAGGTLDCSTDVYALGQILAEAFAIIGGGTAAGPREAVTAVAAKAVKPDRRERYSDAGAMKIAFRRARLGGAAAAQRSAFAGLPGLRKPPRWVAVAAGAALLMTAVALPLLLQEPEPRQTDAPAETAPAPEGTEKLRFAELQFKFEEALIAGRPEATTYYSEARDLSDVVPEGTDTWRWMKGELDTMAAHLGQAENGGPAGEEIRAILRQKHLTYQQP